MKAHVAYVATASTIALTIAVVVILFVTSGAHFSYSSRRSDIIKPEFFIPIVRLQSKFGEHYKFRTLISPDQIRSSKSLILLHRNRSTVTVSFYVIDQFTILSYTWLCMCILISQFWYVPAFTCKFGFIMWCVRLFNRLLTIVHVCIN